MKTRPILFLLPIFLVSILSLSCSAVGWLNPPEAEPPNPPTPIHGGQSENNRPNTPAPPAQPSPPGEAVTTVKVFLVAMEDNGASGPAIGCGDSLVPVEFEIESTRAPLRPAIEKLLSIHDQFYGQSGLYNALYQSDLQVDKIEVENGRAIVELSGTLLSGGVCDDPRIIGQLRATAIQFSVIRDVRFIVNGRLLEDILSGK